MEHRQRRPCHAGTLPAGTVAPGSVPAPAARHRNGEQTATAHDMHRDAPGAADRTTSADRRPEQQRTTRRRPGLFLLPIFPPPALPPACCTGSPAGSVRISDGAACPMTPPAHRSRSRSHRLPPAPGRTSPPAPHQMTPQPTSCTACTPCQTSQQPAAHRQHLPTPHPASHAAHLPQQITPPTAKNHPPQPAAGGVRFFT